MQISAFKSSLRSNFLASMHLNYRTWKVALERQKLNESTWLSVNSIRSKEGKFVGKENKKSSLGENFVDKKLYAGTHEQACCNDKVW